MKHSLSPREAMALARSLGWRVAPKARTGEILYRAPDGRRFVSPAPGRKHHVCRKLAVALARAFAEQVQVAGSGKSKGGA